MVETACTQPRVAEKDILCYKLVYVTENIRWHDGTPLQCQSSVYGYIYGIGDPTWQETLELDGPYNDVTEGYPKFWNVTSGFASYKEKPVPYAKDMFVASCVIPAGAQFFEDQSGTCYASSQIKILSIIEDGEDSKLQQA